MICFLCFFFYLQKKTEIVGFIDPLKMMTATGADVKKVSCLN